MNLNKSGWALLKMLSMLIYFLYCFANDEIYSTEVINDSAINESKTTAHIVFFRAF